MTEQRSNAYLDTLGNGNGTRELAIPALRDDVAVLSAFLRLLRLSRHGEDVVVHVDVDVLFLQSGKLEGGGHKVLLCVLMQVDTA